MYTLCALKRGHKSGLGVSNNEIDSYPYYGRMWKPDMKYQYLVTPPNGEGKKLFHEPLCLCSDGRVEELNVLRLVCVGGHFARPNIH